MRQLEVACAIIEKDGLVCAAQRSARMSLPFKWEFPGGKIETGETVEVCLKREILEELGIRIRVGKRQPSSTYHSPAFSVTLYPFVCTIDAGEIVLHEHAAMNWLPQSQLYNLDWAEADLPVLESYLAGNNVLAGGVV